MAIINVTDLTFCYDGSYDNIFEHATFQIDTDWKLGLIGRNGKGKTTFLNLLLGNYEYRGSITSSVPFQYFPIVIPTDQWEDNVIDLMEPEFPDYELWKVTRELELLSMDAELLFRPFKTLSFGERTRVMLAFLFSNENRFLLIDEPTNHIDTETREILKQYLNKKKGFLLVSHDRDILDHCVDHILAINRSTIEVCKGNFSSWWDNKQRKDASELAQNELLKKDIHRLEAAARQSARWADKVESTKIGFNPLKSDRCADTRAYIGEKSRRMQQRRKNLERRQTKEIEDKKELLQDLEKQPDLKIIPLRFHKEILLTANDVTIQYDSYTACQNVSFQIKNGDRLLLRGRNGCGKSSIIKAILGELTPADGELIIPGGLKISYISQDTSMLTGKLSDYARARGINETLLLAILRQLDFSRVQFEKKMEDYSEGQKKKVLIAASLCEQAHLYIWDEPLNYIDVFSRMQIEALLLKFQPTMLLVEHDQYFSDKIATSIYTFNE